MFVVCYVSSVLALFLCDVCIVVALRLRLSGFRLMLVGRGEERREDKNEQAEIEMAGFEKEGDE